MQRHLGDTLRELGRYAESYELTDRALARARAALGERDPITLALTNSSAAGLRARGDFAAARGSMSSRWRCTRAPWAPRTRRRCAS